VKRFLRGPAAPGLIAVVALVWPWTKSTDVVEVPPPPVYEYTDAARALLGDLAVGDEIDPGWRVVEVFGPRQGRIVVVLEHEGNRVHIEVLRAGTVDATPLLSNGTFDLHYSIPPDSAEPTPESLQSAMAAITTRIGDQHVIPPGL
jgi:hypothetical protein